jgi:hypothetical protein
VVAASMIVIDDFVTTMATADDLQAHDLRGAIIVLVLYGTLWSLGLIAASFFTWAHFTSKSKLKKFGLKKNSLGRSCEVHEYLLSYGRPTPPSLLSSGPHSS